MSNAIRTESYVPSEGTVGVLGLIAEKRNKPIKLWNRNKYHVTGFLIHVYQSNDQCLFSTYIKFVQIYKS